MELTSVSNSTEIHSAGSNSQPKLTGKRAEAMSILAQIPEAYDVQFEPL
jgi:hypothetical protein